MNSSPWAPRLWSVENTNVSCVRLDMFGSKQISLQARVVAYRHVPAYPIRVLKNRPGIRAVGRPGWGLWGARKIFIVAFGGHHVAFIYTEYMNFARPLHIKITAGSSTSIM
jgi:hypothetical protein